MKYWPFFLFFVSPLALSQELEKLTNSVIEIQNEFPTKESVSISSDLEDKIDENCALNHQDQAELDNKSSMPGPLKRDGWKVLFEVKYNSIQKQDNSHQRFSMEKENAEYVENFLKARGRSLPTTLSEMNQAAFDIKEANPNSSYTQEIFRNAIIIRHLENAQTPDQMYGQYKNLTKDLSTDDHSQ